MDVELSPKWNAYVKKQIKSKRFRTTTELLHTALRALQESDVHAQWEKQAVARGIAEAERGELIPVTEEFITDMFARGRTRLAAKQRKLA